MERYFMSERPNGVALSHAAAYDRAVRLMQSVGAKAFDLSEETDKVRETYGRNLFGQGCLLARRLAEYAVRPAQMLHKLPESVGPLEGALVNQGSLGVHALRRVEFLPGSTVAVFGPGLLGLLTAAVASASGAAQIIMVGRGSRLDLAAKMGCDEVVDYEKEDPVAAVRRLTAGRLPRPAVRAPPRPRRA